MDIKIEIKEEDPFSEMFSQTESESFSQDVTMRLNSDATVWNKIFEVETKTQIKEESLAMDFCPKNGWQHFAKNPTVKLEQCYGNNEMETKTEMKEEDIDSGFCPQNGRQVFSEVPVLSVNQSNKDCKLDTKIEIKEEFWWQEKACTEDDCIDITKGWMDESFSSTDSLRSYREEASIDNLGLLSNENSGKNITLNIRRDSPECVTGKNTIKAIDIPEISLVQKKIYSELHDGGKMISKSSSLKYNNLVQQNSIEVHDSSKKSSCFKSDLDRSNKSGKYKCEICDKRFSSPSDMKRHKFIHEVKKPHQCNICEKSYAQLLHLKRHKLTHEHIKPNKSDKRGKCFNMFGKYKCEICDKRFSSPSDLKRHKFIHEVKKPHQCDVCEKSYAQLLHLKRHKLTHDGIKPHKCDKCGKCFTMLTDLNRHKLTHEGIKRHKCDICGNCFTQLPHLKSHKLIHEGLKPHKCDTCKKCFARFSQLKIHKLIHEAIKPHKCNTCGKYFSRLPHLKRHKLIH